MNRESYEGKLTRWLLVAALAVASGGCANEVVDCSEGGEDVRSAECTDMAESEANSTEKPNKCIVEAPGNLCQQPDRDCWPKRENGCATGEPAYLCGYPENPPLHCDILFTETSSEGQNPIWCCF